MEHKEHESRPVRYSVPETFALLWHLAEEKRRESLQTGGLSNDLQVIAVLSATDGNTLLFLNDISSAECEQAMLQSLAEAHIRVARILCMWQSGGVDLPSYAFRRGLLEIDAANAEAEILLAGRDSFVIKTLGNTVVPTVARDS